MSNQELSYFHKTSDVGLWTGKDDLNKSLRLKDPGELILDVTIVDLNKVGDTFEIVFGDYSGLTHFPIDKIPGMKVVRGNSSDFPYEVDGEPLVEIQYYKGEKTKNKPRRIRPTGICFGILGDTDEDSASHRAMGESADYYLTGLDTQCDPKTDPSHGIRYFPFWRLGVWGPVAEQEKIFLPEPRAGVGVSKEEARRKFVAEVGTFHKNQKNQDRIAVHEAGDAHVFSIFDGHGDERAAEHASIRIADVLEEETVKHDYFIALDRSYQRIDDELIQDHPETGCTAATAVLVGAELFIANAGDSKIWLVSDDSTMELTTLHTLENEDEVGRLKRLGANISGGRVWVEGMGLQVTRALGDGEWKDKVTYKPALNHLGLKPGNYKLVIMTDGVWKRISSSAIEKLIDGLGAQVAAEYLVNEAFNSTDDCTAIVVHFHISE